MYFRPEEGATGQLCTHIIQEGVDVEVPLHFRGGAAAVSRADAWHGGGHYRQQIKDRSDLRNPQNVSRGGSLLQRGRASPLACYTHPGAVGLSVEIFVITACHEPLRNPGWRPRRHPMQFCSRDGRQHRSP